jgi:Uma2 family endonuclease
VSPPSDRHSDLQDRLQELLRPSLTEAGYLVRRGYDYTLPSNSRRAVVAALLQSRRNLPATSRGGPDLVAEILSPSNTALYLDQLRTECFAEGPRELWNVNATLYTVLVYSRANDGVRLYTLADGSIPLDEFVPGMKLSLAYVFE